jgi:chemotaxis protein histidine kinase CheA
MSIRLDPRRLSALKLLAAEAGVRPGELVTAWVEERLDAARSGRRPPSAGATAADLATLAARVDELARRVDALQPQEAANQAAKPASTPAASAEPVEPAPAPATPRKRGRPPKAEKARARAASTKAATRVPLHEEIAEIIRERGPLTAGELATAIQERGRYSAPRSTRPLDAATVNSRVSNPAYRARFKRSEGRIGLADAAG